MPDRPDAFVSYAREDHAFVEGLCAALTARGKDVWIDLEDIAPSADWRQAVWAGIESATAFVFVLSPDSLESVVCGEELGRARAVNKRLIVVVRREPDAATPVPDDVQRPNWIWFRDGDDFERSLGQLVDALDTDLDWRDAHARLVVRAREWVREDRDRSFLLRGSDLRAAEAWLTEQHGHAETATQEQTQYILASRQASARRQRITLAAVGAALAVAIALAGVARHQAQLAQERAKVAGSRELAASALANLESDPELSMLLALEAARVSDTDEAAQALRRAALASRWLSLSHFRDGAAERAEFSPDGVRVVAASGSEVRVWNADGSGAVRVLRGHRGRVNDVAFSPDGSAVVSAGADGSARVWDAATGRQTQLLRHPPAVRQASFGRGARTVLTAGDDRVAVWRVARPEQPLRTLRTARDGADGSALSHDGRLVLTQRGAGAAITATASNRRTPLRGFRGSLSSSEFSRDGARVVVVSGRRVSVWSRGGRLVSALRHEGVTASNARFSRDAASVITADDDGVARIFDARTGALRHKLEHGSKVVSDADLSADGSLAVTAGSETARVWSAVTGRLVTTLHGHTGAVQTVRFSPAGDRVLSGGADATGRVWSARPGVTELRAAGLRAADAVFSADGRRVLGAGRDGEALAVWDAASGTLERRLAGSEHLAPGRSPSLVALACRRVLGCRPFDRRGTRIVAALADGSARIWSASAGRALRRLARRDAPYTAASFAPDGDRVLATGDFGTIDVWDAAGAAREPIARLPEPADGVRSAELSRDGRLVLAIDGGGAAALWAVQGERLVARLGPREVMAAAFSGDGSLVVTAHSDGRARIWDARSGEPVRALDAGGQLRAASFSASGARVVTGDLRGRVRVWDASDGRLLRTLTHGSSPLTAVAFGPGDELLLTSGAAGSARLWDRAAQPLESLPIAGESVATFDRAGRRVLTVSPGRAVLLHACAACGSIDDVRRFVRSRVGRRLTAPERADYLHE